jgi:ribonucleoside-triphosphate reductase
VAKAAHRDSTTIFNALAAPIRLQILRLLRFRGALGYSEIMAQLNLNPNRDAGKFAYHLRTLCNSGLITADKETKKYAISPLGVFLLETAQNIETGSLKDGRKLLVRTSRLTMEEFDRSRIVQALIREAAVPVELAQKVAEETEERLLKLDALYLTAPLIREFVNAVLIEKGLHEYRHKLTRLGLPVYDVSQLIKQEISSMNIHDIHYLISRNVFTEYALLDVLPRRIADAHLGGLIRLTYVDSWPLRPQTVQHDLTVFLNSGFHPGRVESASLVLAPPRNLAEALMVALSCLLNCGQEVCEEQTINHFNLLIAPFAIGVSDESLRSLLKQFVIALSQASDSRGASAISLSMDFSVPPYLRSAEAVDPNGRTGTYMEYVNEARRVIDALLDVVFEDSAMRPVLSPRIIFNLTSEDFKECEACLTKVHMLAAERGTPMFANLSPNWQKRAVYHSSGLRLEMSRGDWELSLLRTGILGLVGINIPRVAYEAKSSESKSFSLLSSALNMAVEALRIKATLIGDLISKGLLPVLSQRVGGEPYFRLMSAPLLIGLLGLNEAVRFWTGKQLHEDKGALDFALKVVTYLSSECRDLSSKVGYPIALAHRVSTEAPQQLAELDVDRYGWMAVFAQGTRDAPYYTDITMSPLESPLSLEDRISCEELFHSYLRGGHLLSIELAEPRQSPEALLEVTKNIVESRRIGFFTYTRTYGYCANCRRIYGGYDQRCPTCKAVRAYTTFSRLSDSYQPLSRWPRAKIQALENRCRYRL